MTASGCILSHSPKKPATTASTIGQTGTGKSTLLENMLYQDCESGAGFAVMEPNPDLTHRVLNHISKQRAETVVHIDLADLAHPVPLNSFADSGRGTPRPTPPCLLQHHGGLPQNLG